MSDTRKPTCEQLSALCAQMAAALEICNERFGDISGDWTDPGKWCDEGMEVSHDALTAYRTLSPDPQWQRVPEGALILHVEQKDGWTVITSPQHLGLYVAHQQEDVAMADVLESIRTLTKLDAQSGARGEG